MKTKKGSTDSAEVQALQIMRTAAEKIHGAFRELHPDSFVITAKFGLLVMKDAAGSLEDLALDGSGFFRKYNIQLIRDKEDARVLKDYEILG